VTASWGQIRREIESSKENAQATDAQLAGQRLSIAASVASNYFLLRQTDIDITILKQQQDRFRVQHSGKFVYITEPGLDIRARTGRDDF
jgi:outer membrane protein TolC